MNWLKNMSPKYKLQALDIFCDSLAAAQNHAVTKDQRSAIAQWLNLEAEIPVSMNRHDLSEVHQRLRQRGMML